MITWYCSKCSIFLPTDRLQCPNCRTPKPTMQSGSDIEEDSAESHGRLHVGRRLVLAITYAILLCIGTASFLLFFLAAAADYEYDTPALEARRGIVISVIL